MNNPDPINNPQSTNNMLNQFPNAIRRGGLDVTLPDTDEGEDSLAASACNQDNWVIQDGKVIRKHIQPRLKMFNPVCLEDIPVPLDWLESHRITHVTPRVGPFWTQSDIWRKSILGHQNMPAPWTGQTEFPLNNSMLICVKNNHCEGVRSVWFQKLMRFWSVQAEVASQRKRLDPK